jgi:hypothetical protein
VCVDEPRQRCRAQVDVLRAGRQIRSAVAHGDDPIAADNDGDGCAVSRLGHRSSSLR